MDINLVHRPRGATHAGKEESHGSWYKKSETGHWMFIDMGEDGLPDRHWCVVPDNDPGYELVELPVETRTEPPAPKPVFDGGPAFPVADYDHMVFEPETVAETKRDLSGMSLRDYFAVNAAVCLDEYGVHYAESIVGRKMPDFAADPQSNQIFWADFRARMRYAEADAMLAARSA